MTELHADADKRSTEVAQLAQATGERHSESFVAKASCRPNARLATERGEGLRARLSIRAGDEITCWYGWRRSLVPCLCGEPHCSGWIGVPARKRMREDGSLVDNISNDDLINVIRCAAANDNIDGIRTVRQVLDGFCIPWAPVEQAAIFQRALGSGWLDVLEGMERRSA